MHSLPCMGPGALPLPYSLQTQQLPPFFLGHVRVRQTGFSSSRGQDIWGDRYRHIIVSQRDLPPTGTYKKKEQ